MLSDLNKVETFPPKKIITKDNWLHSEENLRAYTHRSDFGATRTIWRGQQQPTLLTYDNHYLDLTNIMTEQGNLVSDYLEETNTDAFIITRKGKIVYEDYFNGYLYYEPHALNSASKSFVGVLVALMVHEGLLDLNKKSAYYLPELEGTGLGNGTIQQLLDMQVPVTFPPVETPFGFGRGTPILIATGSILKPKGYKGPENIYEFILANQSAGTPGTVFKYENAQTETLAWIMKRVTGKNLAQLIQEMIWMKVGAEENALIHIDPIGTDVASGGMRATLRDLARFGEMMLHRGYYNKQQIIPEVLFRDTLRGSNREMLAKSADHYVKEYSYHNHWWIANNDYAAYAARGKFNQEIYIAPNAEVVIVKLSTYIHPTVGEPYYDAIIRHLL
ncbi:serine hydrolase domain-containing protein [Oceanobacillus kimchii]|uniref:serine hydrolase domain-containing protein n=1 Tax=Oceanobacillus kimchii TaxID=746691 RepID=UPI000984FBD2|nr:serine hydrolase [Oceanobacillus kimchii]